MGTVVEVVMLAELKIRVVNQGEMAGVKSVQNCQNDCLFSCSVYSIHGKKKMQIKSVQDILQVQPLSYLNNVQNTAVTLMTESSEPMIVRCLVKTCIEA